VTFILKRKILYHVRKSFRFTTLVFILLICVVAILAAKFKPVYAVTISGEVVGYVNNKVEFEQRINEEILAHNGNVAFVTIKEFPQYRLQFVNRTEKTKEEELISSLKQNAEITYKYYAVTFNKENKGYVNTLEEAEQIVAEIKQEHSGNLDLDIGITEYYTVNVDDAKKIDENTELKLAKQEIESSVDEYIDRENRTVNGIYLAQTPITGRITSRFGAYENVRSGAHTGLDIAAPRGTEIKVAANGVVTHASPMGSYGNLVIVSHGNGVETYYAHCSKILVKVGQQVTAGDTIALVGSTGNSTGNHLHFEVRINNKAVNPQKYLYK
jgi:murein DD-endopeptidase MepM/ murein hydrolase activator NlpD